MIRRSILRLLAVALLLGPGVPAAAQSEAAEPPSSTAPATPAGASPATAQEAPTAGGLPARAAPPRTLRAYWHLFGAYAVTLLLMFGYVLSLGRRFARVEDEVQRLARGG